jgi:hypothetical protein
MLLVVVLVGMARGDNITISPPDIYPSDRSPFPGEVTITMVSNQPSSTIFYTINGGAPNNRSRVYRTPLSLFEPGEYTVQARAISNTGQEHLLDSVIVSRVYTITPSDVAVPHVSPPKGQYRGFVTVTLIPPLENQTVQYVVDVDSPGDTWLTFTNPFVLDIPGEHIVKARTVVSGKFSPIARYRYYVAPAAPTPGPSGQCWPTNIQNNWWASICRWAWYQGNWQWDSNGVDCPAGWNSSATSNYVMPANFGLHDCVTACAAQTQIMGFPAKSAMYENTSVSCHCYGYHLDNPYMVNNRVNYSTLLIADIECGTPSGEEVIQVSFYDAQCSQAKDVNVVPLNQCTKLFPQNVDNVKFLSCGSDIQAMKYFADDTSCNHTGVKTTYPVGVCTATESGAYVVNSCEHSSASIELLRKKTH